MDVVFGIDFGTTNSALAIYRAGGVEVVAADPEAETAELMRSVLYFNEEHEVFCGEQAILQYVEDRGAGRFMQSIKTFLPNVSFNGTEIFGRRYTIVDLVAIILRRLKARGEAIVGKKVDNVVLGRPVVFSTDADKDRLAQQRLEQAAHKAGFKKIWFQYEPVAAALAFEKSLAPGEQKTVLIGDFGGGTSDFTVIRFKGGADSSQDRREDVLSIGGVYVAGDKLDSQIMWDKLACYFGRDARYKVMGKDSWVNVPRSLVYTLAQWHRIPLLRARATREQIRLIKSTTDNRDAIENLGNIIDDNYGFFLFQAIERMKCHLSGEQQACICFSERNLHLDEPVTRMEFEQINAENFEQISGCVDKVIADAGVERDAVDMVYLTGGTSRIPLIRQMFVDRFGEEKLRHGSAFTSVVKGLGESVPLLSVQ